MTSAGITFGSVCSGIEAASVAWHPLGWRAAWLAEIDPFASAVLAHHYPEVPNLGDLTNIAAHVLAGDVPTVTTRDRMALVTVWLKGEPWVIVDITLRMLVPRELYRAQDFPAAYIIDRTAAGKPLTKTAQVRMCGNSVSPLPMRLIVSANWPAMAEQRRAA